MSWRSIATDALVAVALVTGISAIVGAAESISHVSNISNLYIIGIAILASQRGIYSAIFASILAFLVYDWFFVPPVHEFTVSEPSEYVALLTLLVTTVIIGQLLAVARQRANEAQRRQRQTQLVYDVSQAALSALSAPQIASMYPMALWRLNDTLGLRGSRLFLRQGVEPRQVAASGSLPESSDDRSWLEQTIRDGQGIVIWEQPAHNVRIAAELDASAPQLEAPGGARLRQVLLPLRIESRVEGVVVIGPKKDGSPLTPQDFHLLMAFANQLAVAVDRQARAAQEARARALEESDRMKSALVSSVSHELKTPLAAIKASVTTLLAARPGADDTLRHELSERIDRETDRLTRLVSSLLDMSRLEAGALRPELEWASIGDVVAEVLDRLHPISQDRTIEVEIPDDLLLVRLDFVQISQVVTNLLDNALRYSPADASVTISAFVAREQLRVTVFNEGSHIPRSELENLFEKFYRLSPATGGIGLGLSIARGIVQAHGGRIWAENVGQRGIAFTFTLPSPCQSSELSGTPLPGMSSVA